MPERPDRRAEIENNFTYHPPVGEQLNKYEVLRSQAKEFAILLVSLTPTSREQSLALTHLEEVIFWANASIARNS